jgi:hypothetical protein
MGGLCASSLLVKAAVDRRLAGIPESSSGNKLAQFLGRSATDLGAENLVNLSRRPRGAAGTEANSGREDAKFDVAEKLTARTRATRQNLRRTQKTNSRL